MSTLVAATYKDGTMVCPNGYHYDPVARLCRVDSHTLAALVAPTAPSGVAGVAGLVDVGTHVYVMTCLDAYGGESAPSALSEVVTVAAAAKKVTVTIAAGPAGTVARRIYRTVANDDAGDLLLVATIADNTTLSYLDNIADASLGAVAPSASTFTETIIGPLDVSRVSKFQFALWLTSGALGILTVQAAPHEEDSLPDAAEWITIVAVAAENFPTAGGAAWLSTLYENSLFRWWRILGASASGASVIRPSVMGR